MSGVEEFFCRSHRGTAPISQRELVDVIEQGSGPGIPVYACRPCVLTGATTPPPGEGAGIRRAP